MRPNDRELRRRTIRLARAILREPVEIDGEDRCDWICLAWSALQYLEPREAASKGRGNRVDLAGEMVQVFVYGGMSQKEARKLVQERTGLKYASVAAAHRRFLKTGQPSMLYRESLEHFKAAEPRPRR